MKIMLCKQCGKECKVPPSKENRFKYCSRQCMAQDLGYGIRVELICDYCGKLFDTNPSKANQERTRFCSKKCQQKGVGEENYTRAGKNTTCTICGKVFLKKKGEMPTKTCSPACANKLKSFIASTKPLVDRIAKTCGVCGKPFLVVPSRDYYRYCSKECRHIGTGNGHKGKYRNRVFKNCDWCGKPISKRASYIRAHNFCSNACYHSWDTEHKRSPEVIAKLTRRLLGSNGTSKIEDQVAEWLERQNLSYRRQVMLKTYLIDFCVENEIYVEVNGCYWHACKQCFPEASPERIKHSHRDKSLFTYCERKSIDLIVIWEHDIKRGIFEALDPLLTIAPSE